MNFKDKYSIDDNKKIIISKDAFAIGEVIERLINKIEHTRLSLIK